MIGKGSSAICAILVVLLMAGSMNVSAAVIVSERESMYTVFPPVDAWCTDNVTGWTDYGNGHPVNGSNTVDYSNQQGPDLQVKIFACAYNANATLHTIHIFSLEVYKETDWIRQSSVPWARDSWTTEFNKGTTGETGFRNHTLSVTIVNARTLSQYWCVYYTCEVVQVGGGFDIDYQDYWAKL